MIIDHLHDNNRVLAACALVCKGWTASSHLHLLSSLIIYQNDSMDTFHALLKYHTQKEWANRVKKVTIGPMDWRSNRTIVPSSLMELLAVMPPFPNIEELQLLDLSLDPRTLRGNALHWLLDLFQSTRLDSLKIDGIQVARLQQVVDMVQLASNITKLNIGWINVPREQMMHPYSAIPQEPSQRRACVSRKLKELTLSSAHNIHLIPQLLYPLPDKIISAMLTRVKVALNICFNTQSSTRRFLDSLSPNLEDLSLSISVSDSLMKPSTYSILR